MITNSEIKLVRSLREKKFREAEGLFVVEGDKMVQEALDSSFEVFKVFRESEIGKDAMARISSLSTPAPSLAVVKIPGRRADSATKSSDAVPVPAAGLCLALDGVRDPGNLGTIIRLADWFGIDAIYASDDTVEVYNPKVIQSTMGAIFRKKVIYCNLPDLCKAFLNAGREVYGTFMAGRDIYGSELKSDGLIVMGNEANGIRKEVGDLVSAKIHIPSFAGGPTAESLNVAIATAITVSEFRRR